METRRVSTHFEHTLIMQTSARLAKLAGEPVGGADTSGVRELLLLQAFFSDQLFLPFIAAVSQVGLIKITQGKITVEIEV